MIRAGGVAIGLVNEDKPKISNRTPSGTKPNGRIAPPSRNLPLPNPAHQRPLLMQLVKTCPPIQNQALNPNESDAGDDAGAEAAGEPKAEATMLIRRAHRRMRDLRQLHASQVDR